MRLIDADELIEHAWRDKLDSRELIAKMIDNAPTVKEVPTRIPINIFEKLVSQESVLEQIRAEIRKKMKYNSFNEGYVLYDDITEILDKYKAESER